MWHTGRSACKPESFVKANSIDDQSIAFPVTDGMTKKCRRVNLKIGMFPAIKPDFSPAPVSASRHHQDSLTTSVMNDFQPPGGMKLTRTTIGHTARMRVITTQCRQAFLNNFLCPWTKRRYFIYFFRMYQIGSIHFYKIFRKVTHTTIPMPGFSLHGSQVHAAICKTWCWCLGLYR